MSGEPATKKHRKLLSSAETLCLIDVWRGRIDELRGRRKNVHVMQDMARQLKDEFGIDLSAEEIRTRIHNLTKRVR